MSNTGMLTIPVSPVQKMGEVPGLSTPSGCPVHYYMPELILGPKVTDGVRPSVHSPIAYVTSSAMVSYGKLDGTIEEPNSVTLRRGQYLSDHTFFVGAVQIMWDQLSISAAYPYDILDLKEAEPSFIVWRWGIGMHLVVSILLNHTLSLYYIYIYPPLSLSLSISLPPSLPLSLSHTHTRPCAPRRSRASGQYMRRTRKLLCGTR